MVRSNGNEFHLAISSQVLFIFKNKDLGYFNTLPPFFVYNKNNKKGEENFYLLYRSLAVKEENAYLI